MQKNDFQKGEIVIYKTPESDVGLIVRFKNDSVWLTQKLMAKLFKVGVPTINEHLKNIFSTQELKDNSVIRNFRITASDGKEYNTKHYNLDAIIALGYRVNSQRATQFRIWATKILKQHLTQGYTINEKRLLEAKNKFRELQEAILFLQKQSKKELLKGQEGEILNLLADYSKTFSLLAQYDKGKLANEKGKKSKFVLEYENCAEIIAQLKKDLIAKKEAGDLFGQERDENLQGIINGLYQTFSKKEMNYPAAELRGIRRVARSMADD